MEAADYSKMKRISGGFENFEKWGYEKDRYDAIMDQTKRNPQTFCEQIVGSRRKLYKHGRFICTVKLRNDLDLGGIEKNQFAPFLGMFNKTLYSQFLKNPLLYDQNIEFIGGLSKGKNYEVWESLKEGDIFWNIDLKSAYWQMCYRLGYIDSSLFFKYVNQDEYKQAKRYCVSFLARTNKMVYNYPATGLSYEINCDISVFNNVYRNIRNELYNCISYALSGLSSESSWLEYNIDGVSVIGKENVDEVKKKFKEMNLDFKTSLCIKEDEWYYQQGASRKAFIKKKAIQWIK
jgi:hypothetical protein